MLLDTERDMQKRWDKGYKKRQAHMMGPSVQVCYIFIFFSLIKIVEIWCKIFLNISFLSSESERIL